MLARVASRSFALDLGARTATSGRWLAGASNARADGSRSIPSESSGEWVDGAPPSPSEGEGRDIVEGAYSHSIVAGGFDEMSYTTRLTPGTSLTIRDEILPRTSYGSFAQSAVIPSSDETARIATTFA